MPMPMQQAGGWGSTMPMMQPSMPGYYPQTAVGFGSSMGYGGFGSEAALLGDFNSSSLYSRRRRNGGRYRGYGYEERDESCCRIS